MAKKKTTKKQSTEENKANEVSEEQPKETTEFSIKEAAKTLPENEQKKVNELNQKIQNFKDKVIEKFESYVNGISILPPPKEGDEESKNKIHILVLIDDSDSEKMSKEELKNKISGIVQGYAKEINEKINPQIMLLSELWAACYDSKYEVLQLIASSGVVYDTGMLSAVKISEVHKTMVLKKFEKYIVSYVLAGSLVQGKATPSSDIDVWIVIDDTDVKKMSRTELKDKLRSIIIQMGIEAGEMTGIKNKLNVQVWILTEFWDGLKEANPVFFTSLRDGVPFYDRGVFMPWKNLLKMGRIKPSEEAIDMFMSSGEQMLKRVEFKLREIGMEDTYWAILTPSQAALMLYGVPPPTSRETPDVMRELFVKKEKLLEDKYVKILEHNIQVRKDLEHGTKKSLSGKEVDGLMKSAHEFLQRVKSLFDEISEKKEKDDIVHIYDTAKTIVRDVLKMNGMKKVSDKQLEEKLDSLVESGEIPANLTRYYKDIVKAKKEYDEGKLTKSEVLKIKKQSSQLTRSMVEYMQRKQGRQLERARIKVKYGEKHGEVLILNDTAYIIHDLEAKEAQVSKAKVNKQGNLLDIESSSYEEMEKSIADLSTSSEVYIKQPIFDDLRSIFGDEVEIQVQ